MILQTERTRFLFLDSDTVFLGRVLDELNEYDDDFIVTGIRASQDSPNINVHYIDVKKVCEFDPEIDFQASVSTAARLW